MGGQQKKQKTSGAVPKWFYPAWASRSISIAVLTILLSYVNFYATNYLGLPTALVGILLLVSKVFDGITDLVAGYFVDRTNTRLGRVRPYELSFILYCVSIFALYSVPLMGMGGTAAWLFIVYTMTFSVFSTLLTCAEPVYMARSVGNDDARVRLSSFTGVLSTVLGMVVAVFMPQVIDTVGSTREGWSFISLAITVPCLLVGMVRFFTIKETRNVLRSNEPKIKVRQAAGLLLRNKYALILAAALFCANMGFNMNQANPYYYTYIVGDLSKQSFASMGMLISPVALIITPILSKKMGIINVMRLFLGLGVVGYLLPLLGLRSIPLLIIGAMLTAGGIYPIYIFAGAVVVNVMDYGEWRSGQRAEGIYSSVIGFCSKTGSGVAAGVIGAVMALGGFDGSLTAQPQGAYTAVTLLYTIIPAIIIVGAIVALSFFDLYKKLPGIRQDLEEKRAQTIDL